MIVFLENKGYICVFIRGQCDSLKSSASTETTGIETPELSMVLEKASGKLMIVYDNLQLNSFNRVLNTFSCWKNITSKFFQCC